MTQPKQLVKHTLEMGQPAACISDHGVMYSLVDFLEQCKSQGQKPIIAMEAYVVRDHKLKGKQEGEAENLNTREHLLLLAMNEQGYKNLMRLASISSTEGFYYRPRIDDDLLKQYADGLLATSACLGSRFSQMILRNDIDGCIEEINKYLEIFQGRFFLEIQPTKEYLQKVVNHALLKISKELNIPLVATSDAHYLLRSDAMTHDVLLSMQSNDTLDNPLRWRFPGDTFFVASRQEMFNLFQEECESEVDKIFLDKPEEEWKVDKEDVVFEKSITFKNPKTNKNETIIKKYIKFKHNIDSQIIEQSMDNAVVVADMCDVKVKFDKTYLPKVTIPNNSEFEKWYIDKVKLAQQKGEKIDTKESYYLRYLCIKGLKERGKTSKEYRDRLEYELEVITSMGFPDYFLLLEDVISWCKRENVPVGPGRGCFKPNQLVTTQYGDKPIQDIKQGDMVLTHRKRFKEVKGIQKYQEEKEVTLVKFTHNGEQKKVECTKDHEFFIIPKHYGKDFKNVKWASAQELHKGDILLLPLSNEQAKKCSHKGHEDCLNCFGKKNKEWVEDYNRQYHETASNANRVVEKALNNLSVMVMDKEVEEVLDSAKYSLEEMKELFGMNEIVQFEKENELFSEELLELGYEIAFVDDVLYEAYCGDVYDLTVEGDTSYTVNGVAVHNSAAGSLVSYAVGITNVDPIQYGLLFERFLNPSRGKLPDIDTDFCIENRGRVMNYIAERYGKEHVANIATFGRLQTKAVIKDVAKTMGIPFEEVNSFTRTLPSGPLNSIHVYEILDKDEYKYFTSKYPSLFDYASKLESSPRHVSQHAAGLVVSPPEHPIWTLIPVQKGKEVLDGVEAGYLTQLEKDPVEKLGLN